MNWHQRARKALIESVEHWKKIEEMEEAPGARSCALCAEFQHTENSQTDWCALCPVQLRVMAPGCKDTPYDEAQDAFNELDSRGLTIKEDEKKVFLKLLHDETEFLDETLSMLMSGSIKKKK